MLSCRSQALKPAAQMTTLLFVKEYIRGKMGADAIELRFDEDNLTNEEERLEQTMIEQVYFNLISSPKFGGPGHA